MRHVFALPDLGEGLTEAGIVAWLVAEGDEIALDQPMVEVETAKSTVEIPSPFAGTVARTCGESGDTLSVGHTLVEIESLVASETPADAEAEAEATQERPLIGFGAAPSTGLRRRRGTSAAAPAAATIVAAPATPGRVRVASPLVRRLAREAGISLTEIVGSGPDGLVTRADVEAAITAPATPMPELAVPEITATESAADIDRRTGLELERVETLGMFRRTVAETLGRSRSEIPEATVWVDVDATKLVKLRRTLARDAETRGERAPSLTALFGFFALRALRDFPALATGFDTETRSIRHYRGVNLGFAADTPRGLVVPSVERADTLPLGELAAEMARLTVAAREGHTTPAELTRGTFTVNNYGVFGVDGSAAIINHPEAAILGFGRILERPWVRGGKIVPRSIMQVSLVFDHRVCDGGVAGGFLRRVADSVEAPVPALLR